MYNIIESRQIVSTCNVEDPSYIIVYAGNFSCEALKILFF